MNYLCRFFLLSGDICRRWYELHVEETGWRILKVGTDCQYWKTINLTVGEDTTGFLMSNLWKGVIYTNI